MSLLRRSAALALALGSLFVLNPGAVAAPKVLCASGSFNSTDSDIARYIRGYYGAGSTNVRFTNATGPIPVNVSIKEKSGLSHEYPTSGTWFTTLDPQETYEFFSWGGLDNGKTRRYEFEVYVRTPVLDGVRVAWSVHSNRCLDDF